MAMNENIVKGMKYRIATDDTGNNWDRLSLWTAAEDVEFEDGENAAEKITKLNTKVDTTVTTLSNKLKTTTYSTAETALEDAIDSYVAQAGMTEGETRRVYMSNANIGNCVVEITKINTRYSGTIIDNTDADNRYTFYKNGGASTVISPFKDKSDYVMLGIASWDNDSAATDTYTCIKDGTLLYMHDVNTTITVNNSTNIDTTAIPCNGGLNTGEHYKVRCMGRQNQGEGQYPFRIARVNAGDVISISVSSDLGWTPALSSVVIIYD